MSTSMLYHTFGVTGVQHISTDFLTGRQSCTAQYTTIISNVQIANLAMSFGLGKLNAPLKCCQ